jgi:hypothetical protein
VTAIEKVAPAWTKVGEVTKSLTAAPPWTVMPCWTLLIPGLVVSATASNRLPAVPSVAVKVWTPWSAAVNV